MTCMVLHYDKQIGGLCRLYHYCNDVYYYDCFQVSAFVYMEGDPHVSHFMSYLSLFTFYAGFGY